MTKNQSSPHRQRSSVESPSGFNSQSTFESDGNSLHGCASAISSIIGHDDPTAVRGNIRRSGGSSVAMKSVGTIDSFVSTEHSRDQSEARDPPDENSEFKRTGGMSGMGSYEDKDLREQLREQLSELDRTEGEWKAKMSLKKRSSLRVSADDEKEITEDFYVAESGSTQPSPRKRFKPQGRPETIAEYIVEEIPQEFVAKSICPSTEANDSAESSRASGCISSDKSVSSGECEDETVATPVMLANPPSKTEETDEIVRQVQKRLTASQDDIVFEHTPHLQDSPTPGKMKGKYRYLLPVGDQAGRRPRLRALAAKSDVSDDDDDNTNEESRYPSRRRRRCYILIVLVLIVTGAILAIIFSVDNKTATPSNANMGGEDVFPVGPTSSPTSKDNLEPTPTSDLEPTPSATEEPSSPENKEGAAQAKLFSISGDLLNNPNTPQYAAFDWMMNEDPANLDLDSLPVKELEQRYIAALLYFSTGGDDWDDDCGFMQESSVCEWKDVSKGKGLHCDPEGSIEGISLNDNHLDGPLPFELKKLIALKILALRGNKLGGSVPSELGELSMLEEFDLRQNQLRGTVPESIFNLPQLRKLFLLRNSRLSGTIPSSIELASNLEMMSFQLCRMSGSLPAALGELSKLYFLTLMDNELTGTIPAELTALPLLEVLELSGNSFTGLIPDFSGQPELYFLSMYGNQLGGGIPESIGALSKLLFLDIRDNEIGGPIPTSIGSLPDLVTFFASKNQLTGPIPSFAGNQGLLQAVKISENSLTGSLDNFFAEDGPTKRLLAIEFGSNSLSGTIPPAIGKFTTLTDLVLKGNNLSGSIPVEIGNLSNLDTLSLSGNRIEGTIPEEMGRLEKLEYMDLSNNYLSATIPDTLSMLEKLSVLDLSSNKLTGQLPSAWTALRDLDELHLNNNTLTGNFDSILCPNVNGSNTIYKFVADCGRPNSEVVCTCCTICCNDQGQCEPN